MLLSLCGIGRTDDMLGNAIPVFAKCSGVLLREPMILLIAGRISYVCIMLGESSFIAGAPVNDRDTSWSVVMENRPSNNVDSSCPKEVGIWPNGLVA